MKHAILLLSCLSLVEYSAATIPPETKKLQNEAVHMVQDMEEKFSKNTLGEACNAFAHHARWNKRPVALFVWDSEGIILFDHIFPNATWNTPPVTSDFLGSQLVNKMNKVGKKGGWVFFEAFNSLRVCFVKTIHKNSKQYILGAGFFSNDSTILADMMIKKIKYGWKHAADPTSLFAMVSNPVGPYVRGNMYGVIIDTDGKCWAHGYNVLKVGQNLLNDTTLGDAYTQILNSVKTTKDNSTIQHLHTTIEGIPFNIQYHYHHDKTTQRSYVIAIEYFSGLDVNNVTQTAQEVRQFFVRNNKDAFGKITQRIIDAPFINAGALHAMITDISGTILAYTFPLYASYINRNFNNYRDEKNRNVFALITKQLGSNETAVNIRFSRHAHEMIYAEKITVDGKQYILFISGYYPVKWKTRTHLLVESASQLIKNAQEPTVLNTFSNPQSLYLDGNIQIAVHDTHGHGWVEGTNLFAIWDLDTERIKLPMGWIMDERTPHQPKRVFRKLMPHPSLAFDGPITVSGWYYYRNMSKKENI